MDTTHKVMNSCSTQMIQGNTIQLDDGNGPSGVRIGNLGNFNNSGIQVLEILLFCKICQRITKKKWLGSVSTLTNNPWETQKSSISPSSPHNPLYIVASLDGHHVDFKSFLTLVGEHYIDNFIINSRFSCDIIIFKN